MASKKKELQREKRFFFSSSFFLFFIALWIRVNGKALFSGCRFYANSERVDTSERKNER
jgi:hypothetical protein